MKNHALDPIIVVRVKTSCCEEFNQKLHKLLQAIEGIHEFSIDPKKDLVLTRGDIDPFLLIKEIGKTGKPVELIFYDKEPKIEEDNHQHHHKRSANCCKEKHSNHYDDHSNPKSRQDGKEKHPHFCCRDDDLHPPKKEANNDEGHKDRETPKKEKDEEEDIFKHPYFRFQRSASTNRRVPSWVKKNMFGGHANDQKQAHFDSHSSRHETWNPQCSRFFGDESASYDHYHSRMPPPAPTSCPYDFGDYENLAHYFNDYNPGGCTVM